MTALWIIGCLALVNLGVIAIFFLRGADEGVQKKMPVGKHRHWDED